MSKPTIKSLTKSLKKHGYEVEYGETLDNLSGFLSALTNRVFVNNTKSDEDAQRFLIFADYLIRNHNHEIMEKRVPALYVRDDLFCPIDENILEDCINYVNRVFENKESSLIGNYFKKL